MITADYNTIHDQAMGSADAYFHAGVRIVNETFGDGSAWQYPELVVAYMRTASNEMAAATLAVAIQEIAQAVEALELRR